jgi:hypothetical protein
MKVQFKLNTAKNFLNITFTSQNNGKMLFFFNFRGKTLLVNKKSEKFEILQLAMTIQL